MDFWDDHTHDRNSARCRHKPGSDWHHVPTWRHHLHDPFGPARQDTFIDRTLSTISNLLLVIKHKFWVHSWLLFQLIGCNTWRRCCWVLSWRMKFSRTLKFTLRMKQRALQVSYEKICFCAVFSTLSDQWDLHLLCNEILNNEVFGTTTRERKARISISLLVIESLPIDFTNVAERAWWTKDFWFSGAASTRVSNELGDGRPFAARNAVRAAMTTGTCTQLCVSTAVFLSRHQLGYLLTSDPEIVARVADVLPVMCLIVICDGTNAVASGNHPLQPILIIWVTPRKITKGLHKVIAGNLAFAWTCRPVRSHELGFFGRTWL